MKKLNFSVRIGFYLGALGVLFSSLGLAPQTVQAVVYGFNDPAFKQRWEKLDVPIENIETPPRGYTWGPPIVGSGWLTAESYDGQPRTVQYFDKTRMEINPQVSDPNDPWHITTGLLVQEMVLGQVQTGVNSFTPATPNPAVVAGDPNNPLSPSYSSFKNLLAATSNQTGQTVTRQLDAKGQVSAFQPPENRLLKNFDTVTGHNIADVFETYFEQTGPTYQNNFLFVDAPLFTPNALYVFGRPITEPYWTRAIVAGKEQAVMVQMFERRSLTYTPANTPANQVEMGNVGQHYFAWRYHPLSGAQCRQGMPQPQTPVAPAVFPQDFSQTAASYLMSGPIPVGGPGNVSKYTTGLTSISSNLAVTQDGTLALLTSTQGLVALRLNDNPAKICEAWRYDLPGRTFYNPPLLYNGLAILSDGGGTLHAVRLSDGTAVWTRKQPHQIYATGTPITDGKNLYFAGTTDEVPSVNYGPYSGHLYAVRLSDGGLVWKSPNIEAAGGKVIFGFDGNLFLGGADVAIYGYTRDGQPLPGWPSQTIGGIATRVTRTDNFNFANDRLYVANGSLYALDRNGQVVDTYRPNTSSFGSNTMSLPAIVGDTAYIGVEDSCQTRTPAGYLMYCPQLTLHALSANNFKEEKFTFKTDFPPGSALTVLDGYIYFGVAERFFQVRADGSGFNRQMFLAGSDVYGTPVVRNGKVYVIARDGNLYIVK